ncbi:MAG: hypothetical protein AAGF44_04105 [Pseudomonadota bacterium]
MRSRPVFAILAALASALTLAPGGDVYAGEQVWLDSGQVTLTLPSGKVVVLEPGNHADCEAEDDDCELLPLALAPVRPEALSLLGQFSGTLGGVAQAPLTGLATTIPNIAAPALGLGAIGIGVGLGLTNSTPNTTVSTTSSTN